MAKKEESPGKASSKAAEETVEKVDENCETSTTEENGEGATKENGEGATSTGEGEGEGASSEGEGEDVVVPGPAGGYYQVGEDTLSEYINGNIAGDSIIQKKKGGPFVSSRTGEVFVPVSILGDLQVPPV